MTAIEYRAKRIAALLDQHRTGASIAFAFGLAALGFFALHGLLKEVHLSDLRTAVRALSLWQIAASIALTIVSYILLTFYDVLALNIIGKPLPYRVAGLASFTSYTLSHNLGLSLLTGGSARYRIYSANGLTGGDIARVIATASMTFWAGVIVMAAAAMATRSSSISFGSLVIPAGLQQFIGVTILGSAVWLLVRARTPNQSLHVFKWTLPLPTTKQAGTQILVAGLDLAAASAALYVLVPNVSPAMFPFFFLGYALAIVVALVSHVPGGVGVFEAVVIAVLPDVDKPSLLAALVCYRVIYYLLPLLVAAILIALREFSNWRGPIETSRQAISSLAPTLLALLSFIGGVILLISGSLPAIPGRLHMLRDIVPLPFIEASHIAASLAGTMLLLLAPALYKRLDAASILTKLLLIAGAAFSLAKGFDYEEATILLVIATLLHWSRDAFYRRTVLTVHSLSPGWIAGVIAALGLSLWIGLFAFKHVDYQTDLWWQFAWKGDASRFLRASFAAAILLMAAIIIRFFRPAVSIEHDGEPGLPRQSGAFALSDRTDGLLALTGDKRFLVSPSGDAFLMYQVQGHSWIVMGDPVGKCSEWADLLWQIRERADASQGRLLLYQLSMDALPIAIDLGLQLLKYGEEARVDLTRFTINGPEAKRLRYAEGRALREGASFEIIPAAEVGTIMAELRCVSDAWLATKGRTEKAFSVGSFDPAYLANFDCAVIRHKGRIVAFANIWATLNKAELSIDLMRHADDMPNTTMDFLFVSLMKWGQQQGYRWFTLGLAPLSGIDARRLAPIWAHAATFLYRHGGSIYAFEGLRAYKEKYSPVWEPRYIAGPHGVGLARALIDLQTLIGGGRASVACRPKLARVA
jgi:phosphatidylglycerol lysyltransferase